MIGNFTIDPDILSRLELKSVRFAGGAIHLVSDSMRYQLDMLAAGRMWEMASFGGVRIRLEEVFKRKQ